MIYLAVAYNDGTTLGLECETFNVENGFTFTYGGELPGIQHIIPHSNVKIVSQIPESEYIAYLEEEFDDVDEEPGGLEQEYRVVCLPLW